MDKMRSTKNNNRGGGGNHGVSIANQSNMIEYTAGELVTMARLKKIESEHKSLGATLDKRSLYKIEDPKIPSGREDRGTHRRTGVTSTQLEESVHSNETHHLPGHSGAMKDKLDGARKGSEDSQLSDLQKIQLMVHSKVAADFENEELIWKTKASAANYSLKRKFHNPVLQEFLENLSNEDRDQYNKRCRDAVFKLSAKLRDEMNAAKTQMNESGMFHPDANTHRAHCMYITKLFKAIHAGSIEDPVLRAMRNEKLSKRERELEEKKRLHDHWTALENQSTALTKVAEEKEKTNATKQSTAAGKKNGLNVDVGQDATLLSKTAPISSKRAQGNMFSPKGNIKSVHKPAKSINKKEQLLAAAAAASGQNTTLSKVNSLPGSKSVPVMPTSKGLVANLNGNHLPPVNGGSVTSNTASTDDAKNSVVSGGAGKETHSTTTNPQDKLLFSKMRKSKLAAFDPRKLLPEEAAKLDRGELTDIAKESKRSSLLHEQAADLVLEKLQNDCIFSATGAGALSDNNDEVQILFPNKTWRDIPGLDVVGAGIGALAIVEGASNSGTIPHVATRFPVQPSDSMTYVEDQWRDREALEELQAQKVVSYDAFQTMFKNYTQDALTINTRVPTSYNESLRMKAQAGGANSPNCGGNSNAPSPMKSVGEKYDSIGSGKQSNVNLQPVDVVSAMKLKDAQFNSFLKVTLKDRPLSKMVAKSTSETLTQPRKIRIIAPVGKSALDLSNIRSLRSISGFVNVFKDMSNYKDEERPDTAESAPVDSDSDISSDDDDDHGPSPLKTTGNGFSDRKGGRLAEEGGLEDMPNEPNQGPNSPGAQSQYSNATAKRKQKMSRSRTKKNRQTSDNCDGDRRTSATQEDVVSPLQRKIQAMHHALQLPSLARINFMYKYSSTAYAQETAVAVDLWSEVAVLAICRNEVAKLTKKLQYGYCVFPLHHVELLTAIKNEVPTVLASGSPEFYVRYDPLVKEAEPGASFRSYVAVRRIIRECFVISSGEDETFDPQDPCWDETYGLLEVSEEPGVGCKTERQATANLSYLSNEIERWMLTSLKRANDELDDVICFGNISCREWLSSLNLVKDKINGDGKKAKPKS